VSTATAINIPLPTDGLPGQGRVIASVWYRDDDEFIGATLLVLRPEAPYFRVGIWDLRNNCWDGDYFEDHYNIVPAINGDGSHKVGYTDLGGDY
jgi:hypothetical protein